MSYRLNDPMIYRSEDDSDRPRIWRAFEVNEDLDAMGSGFRTGENPHTHIENPKRPTATNGNDNSAFRPFDPDRNRKSLAEQMDWDFGFGPSTRPDWSGENPYKKPDKILREIDYGRGNFSSGSGSFGFDPES